MDSFLSFLTKERGITAVDVLVNNAGMAFKGDAFGQKEAQETMETNFYGTMRITEALLPLLKAAKAAGSIPRIVNVSSTAGRLSIVSPKLQAAFQDPSATKESILALVEDFIRRVGEGSYAEAGYPRSMYGMSKLALTAWSFMLANQLQAEGIIVNACCPGYCSTSMSSFKGEKSPAEGAETPVWLATRPLSGSQKDDTGGFFRDMALVAW